MPPRPKQKRPVKTTETAFQIIETLKQLDGARLTEVAEELEIAKSTAHRHLTTLDNLEYIVKEGDEYHISFRFLDLGKHTQTRKKAYRIIQPKVELLAEETQERVQFVTEEHGRLAYVFLATGQRAVQIPRFREGSRVPIHSSSAGKAILAEYSNDEVRDILDQRGLRPRTGKTITDEAQLFEQLDEIRERGYSVNNGEAIEHLTAVGVSIKYPDGIPVGGLSITFPSNRLKGEKLEEEIPNLLMGVANELDMNIAYA